MSGGNRTSPWPQLVALGVLLAASAYLLLGFDRLVPVVTVPLLLGALVGTTVRSPAAAAALGGTAALIGTLAASAEAGIESFVNAVNTMSQYANPDVIVGIVYGDILLSLARSGPLAEEPGRAGAVVVITALTAAVAWVIPTWLRRSSRPASVRGAIGLAAAILLAMVFAGTALGHTPAFREHVSREPQPGEYAVDHVIYERAYLLMSRGMPYYEALVTAAAGDIRLAEAGDVRDGKFYGWDTSPTLVRQPWAFRLWRLLAPGDASVLFIWSLLLVAALLIALYHTLASHVGPVALGAVYVAYPVVFLSATWHNIFMRDWWAILAVLGSIILVLRGWVAPAVGLALVAALFREVAIFWLVGLLVFAVVRWLRDRSAPNRIAVASALVALVVFAALYAQHYAAAGAVIAEDVDPLTFAERIRAGHDQGIALRFLSPASYMMFGYGRFAVPTYLLLFSGVAGWILALRRKTPVAWVVGGYVAFWALYAAAVGVTSGYWGRYFMPLAAMGTGLLPVAARLSGTGDSEAASASARTRGRGKKR